MMAAKFVIRLKVNCLRVSRSTANMINEYSVPLEGITK